jgi:hypothetical protein
VLAILVASSGGCFPDNARARHISYAAEVSAMVAGGLVLAIVPPPGDCFIDEKECRSHREDGEAIGLTLLFGGVIGVVTTLVSAQDAQQPAPTATSPRRGP